VLEHTRLALLDRAGGAQPMTSADGRYTIVYNGEVYDHEASAGAAGVSVSHADSDAETVLAAFSNGGRGALNY
jgi:asparagine synthase (glutamine-hydrolysing)